MADYRVISIGTLAAHPLWNERGEVRTGHATATLVTAGEANILVDPSLPAPAMAARLHERSALRPESITHVFITSLDLLHRRALPIFDNAQWLAHEPEIDAAIAATQQQLDEATDARDGEAAAIIRSHLQSLRRIEPAPDSLASGVDLFPLPGVTPGSCGLLLAQPRLTVLICGDAIATIEHLEQGKVLPTCVNLDQARQSFREAIEIADLLILGRDNLVMNPLGGGPTPGGRAIRSS